MEITIKGTPQEIADVLRSIGAKESYKLPISPTIKQPDIYCGGEAPIRLL